MNNGSEEENDASRVDEAAQGVESGLHDTPFQILTEVIKNAPKKYVYKSQNGRTLSIRFWDKTEFIHYGTWFQDRVPPDGVEKIEWIPSAYPRAYYYLGFICIDWDRLAEALDYFERGEALEPTNPRFAIERAQIAMKLKDYRLAVRIFDFVPPVGPHVTGRAKAVALRGKGMALIELGDLASAEKALSESLHHDPENTLAHNELAYIKHLNAGNLRSPIDPLRIERSKPTLCTRCGQTFEKGSVINQGGSLLYVCESCLENSSSRKWWEIWK